MATSSTQEHLRLIREGLKIYYEFISETFKQHTLLSILSIAVGLDVLHLSKPGLSIS
jgi:hypothetical protein